MPSQGRKYDFLIYIGRFRPLHLGHQAIIDAALEQADRVIILAGSANRPISYKNPWSFEQVYEMFEAVYLDEVAGDRLIIRPVHDMDYDDERWVGQVQSIFTELVLDYGNQHGFRHSGTADFRVGLVGFAKDASSFYLKLFPQWDFIEAPQWGMVSATDIRDMVFRPIPTIPTEVLDPRVAGYIRSMLNTDQFRYVAEERRAILGYKAKWAGAPYEPTFVTADAVVTQSGHILLITRGEHPGKGLLALPGGHVQPSKGDSFTNCLHELSEETDPRDRRSQERDKPMPLGILRNYYTGVSRRFDNPSRDPRGFYLTTAFRFVFPPGPLWEVNGGDDASHAAWYPIGSLDPKRMFLDHYGIIQKMLDETGK